MRDVVSYPFFVTH